MPSLVSFRAAGAVKGPFDAETGKWTLTPHPPYAVDVPCRVQALTDDARQAFTAEDTAVVTRYLLTVPADMEDLAGLAVGDLATPTSTGDPLLDGRALRIDDIVRGSLLVERDLFCTLTDG